MSSGRIVLIAFVTSALTSAGAFFALRAWIARDARSAVDAPATALRVPPPPAPPAVATEQLGAEDAQPAEPAPATAASSAGAEPRASAPAQEAAAADEAVVPKVARKGLAAARRIMARAGFKVTLTYSYDEDVSEGRILRQSPQAGTRAPRGSSVRLVVNQDN